MDRLDLFKQLQTSCQQKAVFHGKRSYWQYFTDSLQYLADLEEGRIVDRSRLDHIHIGGVAVREMADQGLDDFIEKLCAAQEEVRKMIDEGDNETR